MLAWALSFSPREQGRNLMMDPGTLFLKCKIIKLNTT